jgi:alanyl-tRNA synthetase
MRRSCCVALATLPVCSQDVPNNYETDLIFPIVAKAAELAGIDYAAAPPAAQTALKVRSHAAAAHDTAAAQRP